MERRLDDVRKATDELEKVFSAYEELQDDYQKLNEYYGSITWMKDYEADEKGKLPKDLKRGVLSEDAVYDLINDNHDLAVRMLRVITKLLEKEAL